MIRMVVKLSSQELDELRRLSTPTVSNAIETFNVRSRSEGFMNPDVKCIFPDLGVMVGYACTATIMAEQPGEEGSELIFKYWDSIYNVPTPRVAVIQDLDQPRPIGSFWGEVNASIHRALGCVGTVTNGGVRDLDEVRNLGFHYFASCILVSHAYVHIVDIGRPVKIGDLVVRPGDLIHGDKHGVLVIPDEIAKDVVKGFKKVERMEREIIECCNAPDFTTEKLKDVWRRLRLQPKKS